MPASITVVAEYHAFLQADISYDRRGNRHSLETNLIPFLSAYLAIFAVVAAPLV